MANKPSWLLQRQSTRLAEAHLRGWLSDAEQNQLDGTFSELDAGQGRCERIKNTPFPEGVSHATRIVAWGMAIIVPIAITDSSNRFDLIDMVVVPILMLSFLLVERLGAELRSPFEGEPNDTPMTTLCRVVERDLGQALGEASLPPPPGTGRRRAHVSPGRPGEPHTDQAPGLGIELGDRLPHPEAAIGPGRGCLSASKGYRARAQSHSPPSGPLLSLWSRLQGEPTAALSRTHAMARARALAQDPRQAPASRPARMNDELR